ncbi:hypothetical protein K492DRAFT_200683 [Lichtheimia hyalospora FSU 10163]|nr:hypothetical protein K492DRAFT_200683 [Lichtheimia hyalospora FSU 10163]
MEYPHYLALYYYIVDKRYPIGTDESTKRKIRDQAQRYEAFQGRLYRNIGEVVAQVHNEGHFGETNTWRRIRESFWSPGLMQFVKECRIPSTNTCYHHHQVQDDMSRDTITTPIP